MIVIVDYGEGNIRSVEKALIFLGQNVTVSNNPAIIEKATKLIVPGQGAFKQAMSQLNNQHLITPIKTHITQQKPFLGICLGFQILFESSDEHGGSKGLGIFPGTFTKMNPAKLKVPHMGWSQLDIQNEASMFTGMSPKDFVYFVHSFYLLETQPNLISATTTYGTPFISAIQDNHIWGTQFHPEKSGDVGLTILKNFIKLN